MMKRSLLLIGLLFIPLTAFSAEQGDRYADLTPVSEHYVKKVVDRAKKGIEYAKGAAAGGGGSPDSYLKISWAIRLASAVLATVDTDLRLTQQERDLIENSPCLRVDTLILEGWMERARQEKIKAMENSKPTTLSHLISLQRYLNGRYKALLAGARDPSFIDKNEGMLNDFDPPPYWCCMGEKVSTEDEEDAGTCQEIAQSQTSYCLIWGGSIHKRLYACKEAGCTAAGGGEDAQPLCPFTSDYLPPTTAGYGCDLSVLERYKDKAYDGLKKEYEALDALIKDRDTYINDIGSVKGTVADLYAALGLTEPNLANFQKGKSSERTHQKQEGCVALDKQWPEGMALLEPRHPFTLEKQETTILNRLHQLWQGWGAFRVPPDYLKPAKDLLDSNEKKEKELELETGLFALPYRGAKWISRSYLQKESVRQLGEDSTLIAKISDGPLQLIDLYRPLRDQTYSFRQSVQSSGKGVRAFAKNLAYFLRRSCIFRPCNTSLDRTLKILFEDTCFPYADGLKTGNPKAYEDCKKNAGI
ncbi:MAG: hypothetical protein PHE68_01760 [Candidatus Peribacteraceae bacterium]|nr:hypothetical protein [Candidatus Peribacteraceae bacterium]MDD5074373.1 hypothetical protein [Candidatus Peribacteraceae bacterium]